MSMKNLAAVAVMCVLLSTVSCVSRETYAKTKAEAEESMRALDAARTDVREMEQHVEVLRTINKKEQAAAADIRAAMQQHLETAPLMRQQADERLAVLQGQVSRLVQQSRLLGREIGEAKQERASLQALLAQYKQDTEESRLRPLSVPSSPAPSSDVSTLTAPIAVPANPPAAQLQAQAQPPADKAPATVTRMVKTDPVREDNSWTGTIKTWVTNFWSWIFG
jgi:hypothetical protein